MSVDIVELVGRFRALNDIENDVAQFKTLVPWIGPDAYFNIIYRPAPSELLSQVSKVLGFPGTLIGLLGRHNGAKLFSGALNIYGVVESRRLLDRRDPYTLPPFNIEEANHRWRVEPDRLLVIGGYRFDGSRACIDRTNGKVYFFKTREKEPMFSWPSLEAWLTSETSRLSWLFDDGGRRLVPEGETVPNKAAGASIQ